MTLKKQRGPQKRAKRNQWQDHYTLRAKKENYAARSVYKLKEIQEKFRLIKKGDRVADLGCAPGSWLCYAAQQVGNNGSVVGIDKKQVVIKIPTNAQVTVFDLLSESPLEIEGNSNTRFNVVLSDMAPATTGNKRVDAMQSYELCRAALHFAEMHLMAGGNFVSKIFQGEDFQEFTNSVKVAFNKIKIFKPQSCRKASKEIYIIGMGKKEEKICRDIVNGQP